MLSYLSWIILITTVVASRGDYVCYHIVDILLLLSAVYNNTSFTSASVTGFHCILLMLVLTAEPHWSAWFLIDWLTYRPTVLFLVQFLPRCMECRRGLTMRILSVRLSVRPSNACIVIKRKKDMFRFLYHTKDHLSSFLRRRMVVGGNPFYLKFWVNRPPF